MYRYRGLFERSRIDLPTLILGSVIGAIFFIAIGSWLGHVLNQSDKEVFLFPLIDPKANLIVDDGHYPIEIDDRAHLQTDCQLTIKDYFKSEFWLDCNNDGQSDAWIQVMYEDIVVQWIRIIPIGKNRVEY